MVTKKTARGRPRSFDIDAALATAQALFHARGYDAVGVAALTEAIGINPPSFYSAFGSKAGLFERVMNRYEAEGLAIDAFASPGGAPGPTLHAYLTTVARLYAADPHQAGCLVLEAARGGFEAEGTIAARVRKETCRERIRVYIDRTDPAAADSVADVMVVTMSGLSAAAREGWDETRLVAVAEVVAESLSRMLSRSSSDSVT